MLALCEILPSSVKSIFQLKVVAESGTKLRLIRPQLPPPVKSSAAPLTVRPCRWRLQLLVAQRSELPEEGKPLKPTVQRLHHHRPSRHQPVPAVEPDPPPNCGTAAKEGGVPGWVAVGGSGAMVLDARSPVSLPLDRLPSAARFRLLRPLQPARAHCQFTDDKPFRVNSRRTARQPRCCFRATEDQPARAGKRQRSEVVGGSQLEQLILEMKSEASRQKS